VEFGNILVSVKRIGALYFLANGLDTIASGKSSELTNIA
jgi:hypothetical protein